MNCPTCGSEHVLPEDGYASVYRCQDCKELFSGNVSNSEDDSDD